MQCLTPNPPDFFLNKRISTEIASHSLTFKQTGGIKNSTSQQAKRVTCCLNIPESTFIYFFYKRLGMRRLHGNTSSITAQLFLASILNEECWSGLFNNWGVWTVQNIRSHMLFKIALCSVPSLVRGFIHKQKTGTSSHAFVKTHTSLTNQDKERARVICILWCYTHAYCCCRMQASRPLRLYSIILVWP